MEKQKLVRLAAFASVALLVVFCAAFIFSRGLAPPAPPAPVPPAESVPPSPASPPESANASSSPPSNLSLPAGSPPPANGSAASTPANASAPTPPEAGASGGPSSASGGDAPSESLPGNPSPGPDPAASPSSSSDPAAPSAPAPPAFEGWVRSDPSNGTVRGPLCSIRVEPLQPRSGDEVAVSIYANAGQGEGVTYLCGEEPRVQGSGGIFRDQRFCRFDTVGLREVWLALDGDVCASAPLEVLRRSAVVDTAPSCAVLNLTRSDSIEGRDRIHSARVRVRNLAPSASVRVECGDGLVETALGEAAPGLSTGYLSVGCRHLERTAPLRAPARVWVDGMDCGAYALPPQ